MMPTIHRRTIGVILCAAAMVAVSGCGGAGDVTTSPPPTSMASTPSAAAQTYSSKAFVVPLTVTVDAELKSPPNPDSPNLLSWDAASSEDNKIRFLVPVELYRPGKLAPEKPPRDYLTYLKGLTKVGLEISKEVKTTVDGHSATLMNLTWNDTGQQESYNDGSLGCPTVKADPSDGCFAAQPDLVQRLAVIDMGETTLLAWARVSTDNPDQAFIAMFEQMLTTVRFR
jgi:hypothetical protein